VRGCRRYTPSSSSVRPDSEDSGFVSSVTVGTGCTKATSFSSKNTTSFSAGESGRGARDAGVEAVTDADMVLND